MKVNLHRLKEFFFKSSKKSTLLILCFKVYVNKSDYRMNRNYYNYECHHSTPISNSHSCSNFPMKQVCIHIKYLQRIKLNIESRDMGNLEFETQKRKSLCQDLRYQYKEIPTPISELSIQIIKASIHLKV